ncbi:class I SAM-dependent methyltransferase [Blastopirellula sp. JC732]|uniref:Class I SAM-dependent methyltransferase n=1 Tax=Blastopirellula sediminis TaxID=2894196 RepID=A0A9X1MMY4_9BACT|nr:class I SAM-dependent methyltransferase [Blastopirellula sediminis]MCC9606564.1 class I SAM-dependent methyltransferase [Blastopirellula sediminis]MCC9630138.1 class I SAM-dependent methyltransferase [Blastopirellula sediminis]
MIIRILEDEVMDDPQEAAVYDAMDHSAVNAKFVADLCEAFSLDPSSDYGSYLDVFDVGTGTALIPIALCQKLPSARVMAIDMSTSMLNIAKANIDIDSMLERIQLAQANAADNGFDSEMFDLVISNSIIHHLEDPLPTLREIIRVTRPSGMIFIRDLLRPDSEEELAHLVETYGGVDDHERRLFGDSLRAALTLDEVRELVEPLGFDPATVTATSDRHWTWAARKNG